MLRRSAGQGRGVIHWVAGFGKHQAQRPAQRALRQASLQVVLQELLVIDLRRQRYERGLRFQLPAHRMADAAAILEQEGIDAVVLGAGEAVAGL